MKAAICYDFNKPLVIEEVDLAPPKPNQVKVRLVATAICHSDIHDFKGELPGKTPLIGGHECAGYIEEVGSNVTTVKPGDPVVTSLVANCGKCYFCITGFPHLCEGMRPQMGQIPQSPIKNKKGDFVNVKGVAGFAEYVLADESQVVKVPGEMPLDRASLLACGVITGFGAVVNRMKVRPFQSVAVMGVGGVGMNAIQGAAYVGAYPVIAVDVVESKLTAALKFGATHTVNATAPDAIDQVKKLTSGRGADYVFIMVGNVNAIKQGFNMIGPRGSTVLVGLPPVTDTISFIPMEFIRSEKTLTGGYMGSVNLRVDIPNLITLYQKGVLKLDEIIAGRFPLDKINDAIASSLKGDAIRNVIMF